jgi:hypothetical protein
MDLVKQNPPEPKQYVKGINWGEIVTALKNNPNEFFLVGEFSPGMAAYLRTGKNKALYPADEANPRGYIDRHYEITARSVVTGGSRVNIFMRWLP